MGSPLRSSFYVGHYKKVLVDAKNQKDAKDAAATAAADVLFFRSMIALGAEEQAIKAIGANPSADLQAVKLYATYRVASEENRELVLDKLKDMKEQWTPEASTPQTVQLMVALIHFDARNYKDALRMVHKQHENLEALALSVQLYIKIERLDLAAKAVKAMADIDDDDALTALANAWVHMAHGGERVQEAFYLLEELVEKYQPSVALLTLMAACKLAMRDYPGAMQHLKQSKDLAAANKEKTSPDTLINTIVCLTHAKKPEHATRLEAELKATYPAHPWLTRAAAMESLFDKQAIQYAGNTPGITAATAAPIGSAAAPAPASAAAASASTAAAASPPSAKR